MNIKSGILLALIAGTLKGIFALPMKVNKNWLILFSLFVIMTGLNGQPNEIEGINQNDPSNYKILQTESHQINSIKIEQEYLEKARKNIEQFRKGDASLLFTDSKGTPLKGITVEINQVSQDFLFGNIPWELTGLVSWSNGGLVKGEEPYEPYKIDKLKDKYKALFNFAVLPYYWSFYEYKPGNPEWQKLEAAINWCLENNITIKGHPLAWTNSYGTPGWLLKLPADIATDLLKARIYENVIGFKGTVNIWDVVNEASNTVPWEIALKDTTNNDNYRYNTQGMTIAQKADWVENAYKWANNANPDGIYILNEFGTLAFPEVCERFYQLIKELLRRNTPIKGIGIQAHEPREEWFSPVEMYATLDLYSEFNLPIHITEFMPQSGGKAITGWREGIWTEDAQAEFAEQFYTLAFGYPSVVSINWWGLSDRNIWLPGGGLLDEEYNPKPVYERLYKLIKEDWMTKNLILKSDKKGLLKFRGFYGKYQIKVTKPDGKSCVLTVHLKENADNHWVFSL
jgi:GH35 family endo-1,4-beta-xylanase